MPLFSVIVCSVEQTKQRAIRAEYARAFSGASFEFIQIDDAKSLCEGYNRGFAQSAGEIVVFSHDDIEFVSNRVSENLLRSLTQWDLVGIAGTSRLAGKSWVAAGRPYIHGKIIQVRPSGRVLHSFGPPPSGDRTLEAMDGVFLATRRMVCEEVPFDEQTFDGFHFYDLDFTHSAYLRGFRLGVCEDLLLAHQSAGGHDEAWRLYAERFVAKHSKSFKPNLLGSKWETTSIDDMGELP
jgi:GT2 family glycosyltransferase